MQMFLGHVLVSQQKPVNDDRKLNSGQNATPGEALEALRRAVSNCSQYYKTLLVFCDKLRLCTLLPFEACSCSNASEDQSTN